MANSNENKSEVLLQVDNLKMHFPIFRGVFRRQVGAVRAVDGVTFDVYKGETLGLVGESGCGKSTTGRAILQLYKVTDGEVRFMGKDLTQLSKSEMRDVRPQMQMIFQDPHACLNPRMTVGSIVSEPLSEHSTMDGKARQRRVEELLEIVGLNASPCQSVPA